MTAKVHSSLALSARSAEWIVVPKAGGPSTPAQAVLLPADAPHRTVLDAMAANPDSVGQTLRESCGKLAKPLTVGIPASRVLLRVLDLPEGSAQDLHGMVELQVDKFAPFSVEEATFSYEILETANGRCRLWVGAIPTKTAETVGACLRAAGTPPQRIDINLLAWWQLLRDAGKTGDGNGSRAFLILERESCDLVITTAGIPVAVRTLDGLEAMEPDELCEEITREILFTLTSLDLDRTGHPLSEISLWHKGQPPELLLQRLHEQIAVAVHASSLETLPSLAEGLSRRALATIPLLDLAPAEWHKADASRRARRRLLTAGGSLLGIWAVCMAVLFGGLQYQKQRLARQESQLAELAPAADNARALRARAKTLEQYIERQHSALECLREVSDLLPPGIELKSFNYHKAKTLELSGEADAVSLVFDFKKEMEKSELFVKTDLPRTQRNPQGKEVFKLIATLPGGEVQ